MSPAALVIGFPSLETGSGNVFRAQIAFFRSIGWRVLFVAVPMRQGDTKNHTAWTDFVIRAQELNFPHLVQTFEERFRRRSRTLEELLLRRSKTTCLDYIHQLSEAIPIGQALNSFIENNDIRVIIANHVHNLPFALRLQQRIRHSGRNAHLATVTHDVQSYIFADNKTKNPWTRRPDRVDDLLRTEYNMLTKSGALIHVSDDDFRTFSAELPQMPHFLALPPMAETITNGQIAEHPAQDLLFVGSHHIANLEALRWYFGEVAPCYGEEPSLAIVGNVSKLVERKQKDLWSRRAHHFTGRVSEIAPYYARSRVVIAPMVSGRGISIKTIEALAYDKPVIGARAAYRGFPPRALREYGILYWDSPSEFANAVMAALQNPAEYRERGRRLYKALFTVDQFAKSMTEVLTAAGIRIDH